MLKQLQPFYNSNNYSNSNYNSNNCNNNSNNNSSVITKPPQFAYHMSPNMLTAPPTKCVPGRESHAATSTQRIAPPCAWTNPHHTWPHSTPTAPMWPTVTALWATLANPTATHTHTTTPRPRMTCLRFVQWLETVVMNSMANSQWPTVWTPAIIDSTQSQSQRQTVSTAATTILLSAPPMPVSHSTRRPAPGSAPTTPTSTLREFMMEMERTTMSALSVATHAKRRPLLLIVPTSAELIHTQESGNQSSVWSMETHV